MTSQKPRTGKGKTSGAFRPRKQAGSSAHRTCSSKRTKLKLRIVELEGHLNKLTEKMELYISSHASALMMHSREIGMLRGFHSDAVDRYNEQHPRGPLGSDSRPVASADGASPPGEGSAGETNAETDSTNEVIPQGALLK